MEATRASKSFGMTLKLSLTEIDKPSTTLVDVVQFIFLQTGELPDGLQFLELCFLIP